MLLIQKSFKFKAINLESKLINPKVLLINNTFSNFHKLSLFSQYKAHRYISTNSVINTQISPKDFEKVSSNLNTKIFPYDFIDNSVFKIWNFLQIVLI